jgi:hypothetical protein
LNRLSSVRHDDRERWSVDTDKFGNKGASFVVQISQDAHFIPEANLSFWACECLSNVAVSGSKHERSLGIFQCMHGSKKIGGTKSKGFDFPDPIVKEIVACSGNHKTKEP